MNEQVTKPSLLTPSRPPIAILSVPFDPITNSETLDAIASMIAPRLLAEAEQRGWRVFFLGGRQESLDNAVRASVLRHPRLQIVGAFSPPFKPLLDLDHTETRRRILEARPDLLLVAFGCPKQEKWINMDYRDLDVPVSIGVGATLAYNGGTLRRAPVWMQRTGTEWLFRLVQEPGRLGGRCGSGIWIFGRAILHQWHLLRSRRKHARLNPLPATRPLPPTASPSARGTEASTPWTVLTAPERLDAVAVRDFGDSWMQAGETARLAIDLGATRFIDSTGVGLLVRLRKRAELRQVPITLCRSTTVIDRALSLMRIEEFFDRIDTLPTYPGEAPWSDRSPAFALKTTPAGLSIAWSGEITAVSAPDLLRQIEQQIAAQPPGARVEIQLSEVSFVDSSAIGFFLGLKKRAWRQEVLVMYRNPSPAIRNVFRLHHMEEYLLEDRRL